VRFPQCSPAHRTDPKGWCAHTAGHLTRHATTVVLARDVGMRTQSVANAGSVPMSFQRSLVMVRCAMKSVRFLYCGTQSGGLSAGMQGGRATDSKSNGIVTSLGNILHMVVGPALRRARIIRDTRQPQGHRAGGGGADGRRRYAVISSDLKRGVRRGLQDVGDIRATHWMNPYHCAKTAKCLGVPIIGVVFRVILTDTSTYTLRRS